MCRPISSGARTSTPPATRAAGPTICSGTTPRTRSTCSSIRPAKTFPIATRCRADPSAAQHRDGHGHRRARSPSGAILTLSLSFNNDGPLGSFFRYICDNGTYKAFYDDLSDGKDNKIDVSKVDVSMDGIELEDREFIAAIKEKREPNGSLEQLLPCMHVLGKLEKIIDPQRKAHA